MKRFNRFICILKYILSICPQMAIFMYPICTNILIIDMSEVKIRIYNLLVLLWLLDSSLYCLQCCMLTWWWKWPRWWCPLMVRRAREQRRRLPCGVFLWWHFGTFYRAGPYALRESQLGGEGKGGEKKNVNAMVIYEENYDIPSTTASFLQAHNSFWTPCLNNQICKWSP